MKEFTKEFLPLAILLAYIGGMILYMFFGDVFRGSMTEFILGMILIMLYATRSE